MRALLAKAESTEFEAEAHALTAKAQDLMARHALTQAMLDHARESANGPGCREVDLDAPYVSAKAFLLGAVASANRCRVVWSREDTRGTIFGYPADLEAVELLFTSLLIQVSRAITRVGPMRDASGTSRTRSFRRSFILGFASRVGERLQGAAASTTSQVASEADGSLLPVLAERSDRVDRLARETFPHTVARTERASNGQGFVKGREAGDRASITNPSAIHDARSASAIGRGTS